MYNVNCAVCSVQCALCHVQCVVFSVQCVVLSMQCVVFSVQCAPMQWISHGGRVRGQKKWGNKIHGEGEEQERGVCGRRKLEASEYIEE